MVCGRTVLKKGCELQRTEAEQNSQVISRNKGVMFHSELTSVDFSASVLSFFLPLLLGPDGCRREEACQAQEGFLG